MRWLFRTLWLLLVVGLLALAALPYAPALIQTYQDFVHAWEIVRQSPTEEEMPAPPDARPALVLPSIAENNPTPVTDIPEKTPTDPFIAEARVRAATDPEAAMQWLLAEAPPGDRLRGMLEVVAVWAAEDSQSALLWVEENAGGIARGETLHHGISLWSQQDPLAAADWIEGMANDQSKATAVDALLRNWSLTQPEAAADWVNRMTPGPIRREAAATLVNARLLDDPVRAAEWAFSEAVEQNHPELLSQGIAQWVQIDPAAAENYLRQIDAAQTMPDALQSYLQSFARKDPAEAAEWLQNLDPAGDPLYQNELHTTLLREWSQSDSIAASAWLGQATPGPARDAAIIGFASSMIDYEPAAVAEWTRVISDPTTRTNWLTRTLQTWARSDPLTVNEWLLTSEIDPALREQINREIKQP